MNAIARVKADNPEDRSLADRCIVGQNTYQGMVITPTLYNNTFVIQQSKDAAVIVLEMSHEPRVVRLNAKHDGVPRWYGDSIGHYEGDTLVIETTNFHPEQIEHRNSPQLKVTERLTRVAPAPGLLFPVWGDRFWRSKSGVAPTGEPKTWR